VIGRPAAGIEPKEEAMKTLTRNKLRDTTQTKMETLTRKAHGADMGDTDVRVTDVRVTDVRVTDVNTGISEVLNMQVGCWRAPVHLWTGPTA
jgi:hypothetical protein